MHVTFQKGSIHGLLGENGAGKSTLMKILFGLVTPDEGTIEIFGERVHFDSPAEAISAGIGMVQQHFSLIPVFTVAENLVLGREPTNSWGRLNREQAEKEIATLSDRYGFRVNPSTLVSTLAVGARQRVEILKALYRGAEILILDEPTAALAPHEVEELFNVLRELRAQGRTVIFISHKLPEVMELCDRVTVLRDGEVVGELELLHDADSAEDPSRLEAQLARMMVGRELPPSPERKSQRGPPLLVCEGISDGEALGPLDLSVRSREIVGVAGVEGNGQRELVELLLGIRPAVTGRIMLADADLTKASIQRRLRSGIGHIAEDRHEEAVALTMSVADNAALGFQDDPPLSPGPQWLSRRRMFEFALSVVRKFRVQTTSVRAVLASLSGGNQQKLVVGRELAREPRLMIAAQPTRGLDVAAAAFVHQRLVDLREAGQGVLLISLDLSEVLSLSDRIVVLSDGRFVGEARPGEVHVETLGRWMTGSAPRPPGVTGEGRA